MKFFVINLESVKKPMNHVIFIIYYLIPDRDPGQNGLTGVTIRGEEPAIEQAKCFIQDLIAVK